MGACAPNTQIIGTVSANSLKETFVDPFHLVLPLKDLTKDHELWNDCVQKHWTF